MTTYEMLVTCFSSTWRYENISCTFSNHNRLKYQLLGFQVQDVIEHFRVLCSVLFQTTTFEISVTSFSSTWRYTNIFPYLFPVLFQTTTFEISVTCFSSTWPYKNIFPYFFPVLFQITTFQISDTFFSSSWRYQTFSRTFWNHNVWNISYLVF